VETATQLVGADYGALLVLGGDGLLEEFIHVGMSDASVQAIGRLPEGRGLLGLVIDKQQVIRVDDVGSHEGSVGFPDGHPPMRSFLGVPIRVGDAVFGNLYLTEKRTGGPFTEADVTVAQGRRKVLGQGVRNHREVERKPVLGEAGDQLQQSLVLPAGVVVAEEDLDRLSGFIERK